MVIHEHRKPICESVGYVCGYGIVAVRGCVRGCNGEILVEHPGYEITEEDYGYIDRKKHISHQRGPCRPCVGHCQCKKACDTEHIEDEKGYFLYNSCLCPEEREDDYCRGKDCRGPGYRLFSR